MYDKNYIFLTRKVERMAYSPKHCRIAFAYKAFFLVYVV